MKKFILLSLLALTAFFSFANNGNPSINSGADTSFPNYQKFGSAVTLTDFPGAPRATKGLILGYYADTATANNVSLGNYIKFYPYAHMVTLSPANVEWMRDAAAEKWIALSSSSNSPPPTYVIRIDSTHIAICTVNSCDTILVTVNPQTITITNDSTIIVCNYEGSCDTINVSPQPFLPTQVYVDSIFNHPAPLADTLIYTKDGDTTQFYINDRQCGIFSPGTVFWDSLLVFHVSPSVYRLCCDGVRRTSAAINITLSAADPSNPRFDAIVLDSTGVVVVQGTAAVSPVLPQLTSCQILLTYIYIPVGSTVPGDGGNGCGLPATTTLYDQNSETWVGSATGVSVNFGNTTNSYHLTIAADVGAFTAGQSFKFLNNATILLSNYSALTFFIRLKSTFNANARIAIAFNNSATFQGTPAVFLQNGQYNFVRTTVGSYMQITIPISAFSVNATTLTVDQLYFVLQGANTSGFYIDYIQLQAGICQPPTSSGITSLAVGNLSPLFTTVVTNATTNPTVAFSQITQSANTVFAGPASGGAANPTFRALVTADLPSGMVNNGLVANSSKVIGLDSNGVNPLSRNVLINTTSSYHFDITGAKTDYTFKSTNTSAGGHAISAVAGSGDALLGVSTSGVGANVSSTSGAAINAVSNTSYGAIITVFPATTNTVTDAVLIRRSSTGTPTTGIGVAIPFEIQNASATREANKITSKWTDATDATRTSQFIISGVNSGSTVDKLYIGGAATQINATRFETYAGANVVAANDLTLGTDGNLFTITGNTQINAITTANWQAGSQIAFIFTGTPTLKNNTAGGAGTATMLLAGRVDFVAAAGDYIGLQYDGTNWYETNRKLASGGGGGTTADNGLTMSTVTNAQLGGTLLQNTTIAGGAFGMILTGTSATVSSLDIANNSIGAGSIVNLTSTSTAAASDLQKGLNIALSGANATASQTTYGAYIDNSHGGTTPVNHGVYSTITNGTTASAAFKAAVTTQIGFDVIATSGKGLNVSLTNGDGVYSVATTGRAFYGEVTGANPVAKLAKQSSTTNAILPMLELSAQSSGTVVAGFGGAFDMYIEAGDGSVPNGIRMLGRVTDATAATFTTATDFYNQNSNSLTLKMSLEGNGRVMLYGRLEMQQGADVASAAGAIAVGLDGNVFELTGTNAVTLISNLNWVNGSEITFVFTTTATLTDGTANSGTDIGMELAGNTNFVGSADDTITLILTEIGGVQRFREKCRSVN